MENDLVSSVPREPSDEEIRAYLRSVREGNPRFGEILGGGVREGYAISAVNLMEHRFIERVAGGGCYREDPMNVYRDMQLRLGADVLDQWIYDNPLTMGDRGFEADTGAGATTGGGDPVLDGMTISEPEDAIEHMERFEFPRLEEKIARFDEEARIREIGLREYRCQKEISEKLLKTGYEYFTFPILRYYEYGYVNYFCAYAMAPDVMERDFELQTRLSELNNAAAAKAVERYGLPKVFRLDHDMTDSVSTLVDIRSMEKIWFPRLERCLKPAAEIGMDLLWHCDGAISAMVDPLIACGVTGFQGFQYECGVDYPALCKKRDRYGQPLSIIGGVSVTRTLPMGTPGDVARELGWLVENHGDTNLTLGCSSSLLPGVKWENVQALMEGFHYYRTHSK